jgi:hypothetical protein
MSEDDRKLQEAKERVKRDTRWKVFMKTEPTVLTLDAWIQWRAQTRHSVLHDMSKSPLEQEALLALIDEEFEKATRGLRKHGPANNVFNDVFEVFEFEDVFSR